MAIIDRIRGLSTTNLVTVFTARTNYYPPITHFRRALRAGT